MYIEMKCPHCAMLIQVPTAFAGRNGVCPACKSVVKVPSSEPSADPAADAGQQGGFPARERALERPLVRFPDDDDRDELPRKRERGGRYRISCPKCGASNEEFAARCWDCLTVLDRDTVRDVPSYLFQAILATLLCCPPAGIVAVVFAAQVEGKLRSGDTEGAVSASNQAKLWSGISFGLGIVFVLFCAFSGFPNF